MPAASTLAAGIGFLVTSVLREDRAAELVIEAQSHDRIGIGDVVGKLTVRRDARGANRSARVRSEIVVAVFELADQIVGDRVSDASARRQTAPVTIELIDAERRIGIGVTQIAIGPAAGEEQQQAIDRNAAAGANRTAPTKVGRIVRAEGEIVVPLDAEPGEVAFDTEHNVTGLYVVSALDTAKTAL